MVENPQDVPNYVMHWKTGSRRICNPPPMDTDDDTVILVTSQEGVHASMLMSGWELGGSLTPTDIWCSYRKGENNFLIYWDPGAYNKMVLATETARYLNLLDKQHRIALFNAICHGNTPF